VCQLLQVEKFIILSASKSILGVAIRHSIIGLGTKKDLFVYIRMKLWYILFY